MTYAIAQFAHLHVASSFSLRYGTASPAALVARAAELGMPALALTDWDGLYGAFKFTQACANAGVRRAAVQHHAARQDRRAAQCRRAPAEPARQGRRGDRRGDQAGRARRPHAVRDGRRPDGDQAGRSSGEIKRTEDKEIDLDAIPRDDEGAYAMIGSARTIGCFQIESPGQRELVKKLAPRDVQDLIVGISLFRPGPVNSDIISPFLRVRHRLAKPRFPHEKLAGPLRETGGVVVFHEQVLQIIDAMTGLSQQPRPAAGVPPRAAPPPCLVALCNRNHPA